MPYITSIEQIGRTEGRNEGRTEALRESVLNVVTARWGSPSEALVGHVNQLQSDHQLATFLTRAALAQSVDELLDERGSGGVWP